MADAKISALPSGASVVAADIIPYVNILSSVTARIGVASLFTNTIMQTPSVTGGTLTNVTIVSPSVTGTLNTSGAVIIAGSPLTVTGASITGATLNQPILVSPSVTGTLESTGGINIIGAASIAGGANISGGNVLIIAASSALGYGAGAGGTVTQSVGGTKEQAVSLNRAVGKIIMSNSVMAASVITSMLFGNSVMGVNDVLAINYIGNGLGGTNMRAYVPSASMVSPGAAIITIKSLNNFADTSSVFLGFAVIKGAIT